MTAAQNNEGEPSSPTLCCLCGAAPYVAKVTLATSLGWDSIHLHSDTTWNPGRNCWGGKGQAYYKAFRVRAIHSEGKVRTWKPQNAQFLKTQYIRNAKRLLRISFWSPCTNKWYIYCINLLLCICVNGQETTDMSIKLPKNFPSCVLLLRLTPGIGIQTAILEAPC